MKITDKIRKGYNKLVARKKGANVICEDNYQKDMISPSRAESTTSAWNKITNPKKGLERRYRNTSIEMNKDDERECRGDIPPPFGLDNGVVPQEDSEKRYSESRLQSKITKGNENGFEGWMSPSPYGLGYKSGRNMAYTKYMKSEHNKDATGVQESQTERD